MPVSIADFARKRRTFSMDTELGAIQWTYRPYQMTPAREAEIARIVAKMNARQTEDSVAQVERVNDNLVLQFCEVVEATDMIGPLHEKVNPKTGIGEGKVIVEAGDTVQITPQVVQYFSGRFIIETLVAIGQDARPKKEMPED